MPKRWPFISIGNAGSDVGQAVLEQPSERGPNRGETALSPAQVNVAIGTEAADETTDRILNRQFDLDVVSGGRWRKRLRWLIAAMLAALGVAVVMRHFGVGI